MVIPPWLNISPDLFLQALASGTSAGQRARSLTDSETNSAFSRNRAGYGGGSPTLKVGGLFDGLGSRTDMNRPEEDYKSKRDYAQQLYSAMVDRLGEDEAMAQSGLGALLTPEEISARASLARAKATAAPENPWQTFSLGAGELGRVNKSTGEYEKIKPARPPFQNVFDTITERQTFPEVPAQEATEAVTKKVGGFPIFHWGGKTVTNSPAMPATPLVPEKTISTTRRVPRAAALPWDMTGSTATNTPAATEEIIRVTKDGRRAIFNATTKEFVRYAD